MENQDGDEKIVTTVCARCRNEIDITKLEPGDGITCPYCGHEFLITRQFGNFLLERQIGAGGMGAVFLARDMTLDRVVAVKVLRPELLTNERFMATFLREAEITGSLNHPNIVQVFAFGEHEGVYYMVVEYISGGSLDDKISEHKRITELEGIEIGISVARGLQCALEKGGLIHRDIKPGNILFNASNTAKVVDFGLSLSADTTDHFAGEIWGTPYYVAPEKLENEPETFSSDLYSLGATLFHAISGRPPYSGDDPNAVAAKHLSGNVISLKAFVPDISDQMAYAISKAMARYPEDRYESYDAFIQQLEDAKRRITDPHFHETQHQDVAILESSATARHGLWLMTGLVAITVVVLGLLIWKAPSLVHGPTPAPVQSEDLNAYAPGSAPPPPSGGNPSAITPASAIPMPSPVPDSAPLEGVPARSSGLPAGWTSTDIGDLSPPGSVTYSDGVFSIQSAGTIWRNLDRFNYTWQILSGDQTLIARVTGLTNTNPNAKAGLMFRVSRRDNTIFVFLSVKPSGSIQYYSRDSFGNPVIPNTDIAIHVAPSSNTPVWLKLVKSGNSFTASYSTEVTTPLTWTQVGTPVTPTFPVSPYFAGLAVCSDRDNVPATGIFDNVSPAAMAGNVVPAIVDNANPPEVSTPPMASVSVLPPGWTENDIGNSRPQGSTNYANGVFTVQGGGKDIWLDFDQFYMAGQSLTGDKTLIARITGFSALDRLAKGGLMFRESTGANAKFILLDVKPGGGVELTGRFSTGANAVSCEHIIATNPSPSTSTPMWLKLVKSGDSFTAYYATSVSMPTDWTSCGPGTTLALSGDTYRAGLVVCSHSNNTALATCVFDNVSPAAVASNAAPVVVTNANPPEVSALPKVCVSILPPGWTDTDIGGSSPDGSAVLKSGVFTLNGGGRGVWTLPDQFNFASQNVSGDQTLVARLTGFTAGSAGLMFRDSTEADAIFVSLFIRLNGSLTFFSRNSTGAQAIVSGSLVSTGITPSPSTPIWLKLVKSGTTYTAYYSTSETAPTNWTSVGTMISVTMSNNTYLAGLAVGSGTNSTLATGNFDNVSVGIPVANTDVTPTPVKNANPPPPAPTQPSVLPPGWTDTDIGYPRPGGSAVFSGGVFTVQGSGSDIKNASDQFNFVSQKLSGDQTLMARVTGITHTHDWAKAGLMFRDSMSANSVMVILNVIPTGVIQFYSRNSAGATLTSPEGRVSIGVPPLPDKPVWLKLVKSGDSFTAYYATSVAMPSTWIQVGTTSTVTLSNSAYLAGLAVTSHMDGMLATGIFDNVSVSAGATAVTPTPVNHANSTSVSAKSTGSNLPAGWADVDIPNPTLLRVAPGSASYNSGTGVFTVNGAGDNITGVGDDFHYVYQSITGDVTIVARVVSVQNTNAAADAGVMIRETLEGGSTHASVFITPGNGVAYINRSSEGGKGISTNPLPGITAPYWVKAVRSGTTFTVYVSSDGKTWTTAGSTTISMANNAYVGLGVCSFTGGPGVVSTLCTATFDNVNISTGTTPLPPPRN